MRCAQVKIVKRKCVERRKYSTFNVRNAFHIVLLFSLSWIRYDFFYYKEHLFLVSELLRENLYEFGKFVRESGDAPYFTLSNLKKIGRSILEALDFVHNLGLIHCDVKVWACSLFLPCILLLRYYFLNEPNFPCKSRFSVSPNFALIALRWHCSHFSVWCAFFFFFFF